MAQRNRNPRALPSENGPAASARPEASPPAPRETAVESVWSALVAAIAGGVHPPGSNLPPERELARLLGASRPTVREALRRLVSWNLVAVRRGSGAVVRARRDWSIDVLPAYVRAGASSPDELARVVRDLLALRRVVFIELLRVVGGRLKPGTLAAARAHVENAWAAKDDPRVYIREDFAALREIVEAADFLPALWLLGRLGSVYAELATQLSGATLPPDYLRAHRAALDALEAGRTDAACRTLADYLERHDRRLLAELGIGHRAVAG